MARNRLERPRQRARGHELDARLLPLRSSAKLDRKLGKVLKQRRHELAHAWTDEATYVLSVVDSPGLRRNQVRGSVGRLWRREHDHWLEEYEAAAARLQSTYNPSPLLLRATKR